MLLNAVVITWFAFFALGLSVYLGQTIVETAESRGGFLGPTFNVVGESLKYCIVMILMAIICFQAPSLASALTGGAAIQQGVQMLQSAMIAGGLRSAPSSQASAAATGGAILAGAGLPYAAGRATGVAAAATGRAATNVAAGAVTVARAGYQGARMAAYRLAALRGQSRR